MTPAVTPDQPQKMSMEDFASSIRSKYPGTYDTLPDQELANRVLMKYPVYRQHVDMAVQEAPAEPSSNPAIRYVKSVGQSIIGLPKSIGQAITAPLTPEEEKDFEGHIRIPGEVTAERLLGGRQIVNAGKDYAAGKVTPSAAISVLPEALGQGTAAAAIPEITRGIGAGARAIPGISDVVPNIAAKSRAIATVGARDAISRVPVAGRLVQRPSIFDYVEAAKATGKPRAIEPPPSSPVAQHLQDVIAQGRERAALPPFPNRAEGLPEIEAMQPEATAKLRSIVDADRQPIDTSKARVGQLLDRATNAQPLAKGIPLKDQGSSVVESFKYDPASREMTVSTKNGGQYIHGDVSAEQARAFEQSGSKGKAWNDLRNNSTLVAKVVNGKRVAIKPPNAIKTASP